MNKICSLVKCNYQIKVKEIGFRIDKFMRLLQPQWSKVFVLKLLRTKKILVNNKKINSNYKLQLNDSISYYGLNEVLKIVLKTFDLHQLSKLKPLDVVYEDEFVIIVHKPSGITVQPSKKNHYDHMNNRLLNYLQIDPKKNHFLPVFAHRLDTNTSGLLIGAKTIEALQQLNFVFKNRHVQKFYQALVWNPLNQKEIIIKNHLQKDFQTNYSKVINSSSFQTKFAHSRILLIKNYFHQAHVTIQIYTGRTHQIRVHLATINHPVCGDCKYGMTPNQKKLFPYKQALVATCLIFDPKICVGPLKNLNQTFELKKPWFTAEKFIIK